MEDTFKIIEELPKGDQLNIFLELLQELGGSVQVRRNQFNQYWAPRMADQLEKERWQCELVKNKIRQLYNENIPDELPIQNIAQP